MRANDIKTIDVNCKEWFDKVNGNSYFSGTIVINYGRKDEKEINIPFQYGYGDSFRYEAFKAVQKELNCLKTKDIKHSYWQAYKKYKIKANHSLKTNCLKRELL